MRDLAGVAQRWFSGMTCGVVLLVLFALVLTGCGGAPQPTASPQPLSSPPPVPTSSPTPTPFILKLLRVEPVTGYVGDPFTVKGEGLPPGKELDVQWVTWDGSYTTQATPEGDVLFLERLYTQRRMSLGHVVPDAQGRVVVSLTVPEDYGEVHDIYLVLDGQDVGKGGFRIFRRAIIAPSEGPVGTPITITITGLGWRPFESTMAVRYDNKYTGFVSAVTTRGTATAQIRAAGPVGQRTIQITAASPGVPFLNNQQSGTAYIPNMDLQATFTVTRDAGPPPPSLQWPDPSRVALLSGGAVPKTAALPGVTASLEPSAGPTMTTTTLRAGGLAPNANVELLWAIGPKSEAQVVLPEALVLTATTAQDGSLRAPFQVTSDRGGWQWVWVVQDEKVLASVPFYVERNLVGVTPLRVKAGEKFTVQLKGGGWTELDKGVAVTYDNAYIGYACSVTSAGDITIELVATGTPGTHLVDLYPMVYRHSGPHPAEFWNFEIPQLTALQDHPGLALGYRLPIFRLAIEVVE
ncbi:MAG: hypothetical protein HY683_00880 [Chloroflexi bacterium]|nr:hypothetical protein [Chloroflexota bacterium]